MNFRKWNQYQQMTTTLKWTLLSLSLIFTPTQFESKTFKIRFGYNEEKTKF